MKGFVIAGIGTGIGKTFISSIVTEALEADYFKPIQAGSLRHTDSMFVKKHISNKRSVIHPEQYRLKTPASPHYAAAKEGVRIQIHDLKLPDTSNILIVEPAGGLMVPLNDKELYIDWIQKIKMPVILVSDIYLGSINHTLLSVEALHKRKIKTAGIIFNHHPFQPTEYIIHHYTKMPVLLQVRKHSALTKAIVREYAAELRPRLLSLV